MKEKDLRLLEKELEEAHDLLRSLASELGAGGYNAPTVTTKIFEGKIRWGIDHLVETLLQDRKVGAAHRLIEAIRPFRGIRCSNMTTDVSCGKCFFCVTEVAIRDFDTAK